MRIRENQCSRSGSGRFVINLTSQIHIRTRNSELFYQRLEKKISILKCREQIIYKLFDNIFFSMTTKMGR
jgi:hypothetical protein